MKTPTPQEQAEAIIKMHLPFVDGVLPETIEINATKAAIVTVEYTLKQLEVVYGDKATLHYHNQKQILTILKGKL